MIDWLVACLHSWLSVYMRVCSFIRACVSVWLCVCMGVCVCSRAWLFVLMYGVCGVGCAYACSIVCCMLCPMCVGMFDCVFAWLSMFTCFGARRLAV